MRHGKELIAVVDTRLRAWNSRDQDALPRVPPCERSRRACGKFQMGIYHVYMYVRAMFVLSRFQIPNKIRQTLEARILEATTTLIVLFFLDARNPPPSCQRGCGVVLTTMLSTEELKPACRHAVLTGVVWRSEIRLRGGISG